MNSFDLGDWGEATFQRLFPDSIPSRHNDHYDFFTCGHIIEVKVTELERFTVGNAQHHALVKVGGYYVFICRSGEQGERLDLYFTRAADFDVIAMKSSICISEIKRSSRIHMIEKVREVEE